MADCMVEKTRINESFFSSRSSISNFGSIHCTENGENYLRKSNEFDGENPNMEIFSSLESNEKKKTSVYSTNIDERNQTKINFSSISTERKHSIQSNDFSETTESRPSLKTSRSSPSTSNFEQILFNPLERFLSINEENSSSKRFRSRTITEFPHSMKNEPKYSRSNIYLLAANEVAELIQSISHLLIFDCGSPLRQSQSRIRNSFLLQVSDKISRKRFKNNQKKDSLLQFKQINQTDFVILYDDNTKMNDQLISQNQIDPKDLQTSLGIRCVCEEIQSYFIDGFPPVIVLNNSFEQFSEIYPNLCQTIQIQSVPCSPMIETSDSSPTKLLIPPHTAPVLSFAGQDLDLFSFPMSHIAHGIYIGSESDARNLERLTIENIQCVVNVTSHLPLYHADKLIYCHLPADDTSKQNLFDYFNEAFAFIQQAVETGKKVLVHCVAGISRSPAIVISFLMRHSHLTMNEAYELVKRKRSIIAPNLNFMGQLTQYEKKLKELH